MYLGQFAAVLASICWSATLTVASDSHLHHHDHHKHQYQPRHESLHEHLHPQAHQHQPRAAALIPRKPPGIPPPSYGGAASQYQAAGPAQQPSRPRSPSPRSYRLILTEVENGFGYTANVIIKDALLRLLVDTGSMVTWAFSDAMPERYRRDHGYVKNADYWTLDNADEMSLPYQGMRVEGAWTKATLRYGGDASGHGYTRTVQVNVGLAAEVAESLCRLPVDGVIGFGAANPFEFPYNLLGTLMANGNIPEQLLVFDLLPARFGTSTLDIGTIDGDLIEGGQSRIYETEAHWVNDLSWGWSPTGFGVGPISTVAEKEGLKGLIDSGSPYIRLSRAHADEYWNQVRYKQRYPFGGTGRAYLYDCGTPLPDFHVQLDRQYVITIPGAYLDKGPYPGSEEVPKLCHGAILAKPETEPVPNWGYPVMFHGITIFKQTGLRPKIGVAVRVPRRERTPDPPPEPPAAQAPIPNRPPREGGRGGSNRKYHRGRPG